MQRHLRNTTALPMQLLHHQTRKKKTEKSKAARTAALACNTEWTTTPLPPLTCVEGRERCLGSTGPLHHWGGDQCGWLGPHIFSSVPSQGKTEYGCRVVMKAASKPAGLHDHCPRPFLQAVQWCSQDVVCFITDWGDFTDQGTRQSPPCQTLRGALPS